MPPGDLTPGAKLLSAVCETEVIVIRAPDGAVELGCGGAPLVAVREGHAGAIDPDLAGGTQIGKRYAVEANGLELLCTCGGDGTLTCDGIPIPLKDAKPLPASD